jgi:lysophospholipid acyltransferase (LPLAT)-like uncharacterized protein
MKKMLPGFAALVIRAIAATMRVTTEDHASVLYKPDHPPMIFAFWHNRMFLMAPFYQRYCRGRTNYVFISRSRDGQFITEVAARFGTRALRGSSSRHGMSAALAALRKADDPRADISITPDGPRGPRYQVQPGVLRLAQASGRPIVAADLQLGWKIELKSWDKFQIPLPFSRCRIVLSEPMHVPPDASEEEMTAIGQRLGEALGS